MDILGFLIVAGIVLFAITRLSPDSKLGMVVAPVAAGIAATWDKIWQLIGG